MIDFKVEKIFKSEKAFIYNFFGLLTPIFIEVCIFMVDQEWLLEAYILHFKFLRL